MDAGSDEEVSGEEESLKWEITMVRKAAMF